MTENFLYDVFVCHASEDQAIARTIANRLKKEGFNVWFEGWRLGSDSRADTVDTAGAIALDQSRVLLLLVSDSALRPDRWPVLEAQTFKFRDPASPGRRFVPLHIGLASLPESLQQFAFVDWNQKPQPRWMSLLQACAKPRHSQPRTNSRSTRWQFPGHRGGVRALSLSSDGLRGYSATTEGEVLSWDLRAGLQLSSLKSYWNGYGAITLTRDGDWAFTSGSDIELWGAMRGCRTKVTSGSGGEITRLAVNADGARFVSSLFDGTIRTWEANDTTMFTSSLLTTPGRPLVALSRNGKWLVSLSNDSLQVCAADSSDGLRTAAFTISAATSIGIDDDGTTVLVGSADGLIQIIDVPVSRCVGYLEGHKGSISVITFVVDAHTAMSASHDGSVRLWKLDSGTCLVELIGSAGPLVCMAATANAEVVFASSHTGALCVWQVDLPKTTDTVVAEAALRYTNAKVLLVGESGVGKSALAHRLVHDAFVATSSTDGTWATQMKLPIMDGQTALEREIWLWDFAGQADYRLIHQLFFDETALAVLVFNPQSEDPFDSLAQWDNDLLRAAKRPYQKLLVAGRVDRGRLMVSQKDVDEFVRNRHFAQYLETSASTGSGCLDLRQTIVSSIPWGEIPWTASPRVFKLLKDAIVALKDEAQNGGRPVVLRTVELKQQLELRLVAERFTLEELHAVVALLAGPGIIWHLAFGDFVLLQPERINAYAAAVVRSVRSHPDEIGVIEEDKILSGELDYADLKRIPRVEELIVLRAMHQAFVDRGLCLRQHTSKGTLLLFPSYFRRQRPNLSSHPAPLVTYRFSGQLDEIYATLVVRLCHTTAFEKDQLWRFAADFLTPEGRRAGFKMTKVGEGSGELTIYCDPLIPDDTKVTFIRYVHDHLNSKDHHLQRERHYVCLKCQNPIDNSLAVKRRLGRGEQDIACADCEARVPLVDLVEKRFASEEILGRSRELEAAAVAAIDSESKELILVGHAFAIAGEAGQIFRTTSNSDWGIDGEIEFKDKAGRASGMRLYLQLKSGDSYLVERRSDGAEIFRIKNKRHLDYWRNHAYPVMLVVRTSDARIRWMNITDYLDAHPSHHQVEFKGEPFTAASVRQMRSTIIDRATLQNRTKGNR